MRLPRGSSSPLRRPAVLNDWQGVPPTSTSNETSGHPLKPFMSPQFGTPGYRCDNKAHANASTSEKATGSHPRGCHAALAASMPEQTDKYLNSNPPKGAATSDKF